MKRPRVLFVSRERIRLPLNQTQTRKWASIERNVDLRVLAAAAPGSPRGDDRFSLARALPALDGPAYYAVLPARIGAALRAFRPDVVFVQGVHEAAEVLAMRSALRSSARVVLDVQGDWRAATRLYGSPARQLLNRPNDLIGELVVRRVDGVRTLSNFTSSVVRSFGVEPVAEFAPFVDTPIFLDRPPAPLPTTPAVLFVGVLERYKGFDTLAAAWPSVEQAVPGVTLHVVGRGKLAPLARAIGVRWTESLDADGVRAAMDEASVFCLPSRAEGLGRVLIEAMCRGRTVVGGRAGGIVDLVTDGEEGLLVHPDDDRGLAHALTVACSTADRLGAAARRRAERIAVSPDEYGDRVAGVVRAVLG